MNTEILSRGAIPSTLAATAAIRLLVIAAAGWDISIPPPASQADRSGCTSLRRWATEINPRNRWQQFVPNCVFINQSGRPGCHGVAGNRCAMQKPDPDNSFRRFDQGVPAAAPAPGTKRIIAGAFTVLSLVLVALAPQSHGVFADDAPPSGRDSVIRNSSIDAGSGRGEAGDFSVTGTIGQPDPGVATGESFTVRGGFWTLKAESDRVFRNGFE